MRFLHLADVHLDTPFARRSRSVRDRLRAASREAVTRACDLSIREGVHAVLIAGDLFDGERFSFESERFLVGEFERLARAGISVVYATGNHDPGRTGRRAFAEPWPDNVTVVGDREPRRIELRDPEGSAVGFVTAAGHASPRETMDLARTFPRPVGELPEVGLLHTQVHEAAAAERHDPYAPSELAHLKRTGFHYWALGHVHERQALSHDPPIHYAGNPQGRTPAERGPRGALLVDLSDPASPTVDFHALGPVRWETVVVDGLGGIRHFDGLVRRIAAAWAEDRSTDSHAAADGWMVRVDLTGPTPLWRELREEEDRRVLEEEVAAELGAIEVDVWTRHAHAPIRLDRHLRRTDVLGEALRLLDAVAAGEARLDGVGPGELAACERDRDLDAAAYVRELLADTGAAGAELAARLLTDEALEREAERGVDEGTRTVESAAPGPAEPARSGEAQVDLLEGF